MTIDEAKRLLNLLLLPMPDPFDPDYQDAIGLGIEALKRIVVGRRTGRFSWEDKLPGETEE